MRTYYIVKGKVTCPDAHPRGSVGDTEWQFSDAPPDSRSTSQDFLSIEEGLRTLGDARYIMVPDEPYFVRPHNLDGHMAYVVVDSNTFDAVDGVFHNENMAWMHCNNLIRLATDNFETSQIRLTAEQADFAGRTLLDTANSNPDLEHVALALIALGNDVDALVCPFPT